MSPLWFVLLSMAVVDGDVTPRGEKATTVLKEPSLVWAPAAASATIAGCRETSPRGATLVCRGMLWTTVIVFTAAVDFKGSPACSQAVTPLLGVVGVSSGINKS
ncbi:unnamed protein product [Lampetra fluviatilis]